MLPFVKQLGPCGDSVEQGTQGLVESLAVLERYGIEFSDESIQVGLDLLEILLIKRFLGLNFLLSFIKL